MKTRQESSNKLNRKCMQRNETAPHVVTLSRATHSRPKHITAWNLTLSLGNSSAVRRVVIRKRVLHGIDIGRKAGRHLQDRPVSEEQSTHPRHADCKSQDRHLPPGDRRGSSRRPCRRWGRVQRAPRRRGRQRTCWQMGTHTRVRNCALHLLSHPTHPFSPYILQG